MNNGNIVTCVVLAVVVILLVCGCCFVTATAGGIFFLFNQTGSASHVEPLEPIPFILGPDTPTPVVLRPTIVSTPTIETPVEVPPLTEAPLESTPLPVIENSLTALQAAVIPENDLFDLARRLEGKENISPTVNPPLAPFKVGDQLSFWAENQDTHKNFQIKASLRYATEHLYFWVENGVLFYRNDVKNISEAFENEIYPKNREFFGSEWMPGVDGDPHIYLLYTRNLGDSVGGYFSSRDPFPPSVSEYSNAHEMIMVNADTTPLSEDYTYGVLAHEFEHMIQWYQDRNESNWLDEGFAELAAFLNGRDIGGFDSLYAMDPDIPLTHWPEDDTSPYYGSSFLFVDYFLNRFGEKATRTLIGRPENGLEGIDVTLKELGAIDPLTGKLIQADDILLDWALANFIQDENVADGRYFYPNYPNAPKTEATEEITSCPQDAATRDVYQYGVDYVQIACEGDYTLHFEGSVETRVVPTDIKNGSFAFYSNRGDESDMTLTREFDFGGQSGPLTLTYWTWYELEEDFDYVYLEASTDGKRWQILNTPSGTGEDPNGSNYGWGYTGKSASSPEWIQEKVDISKYAGQKVQLRFEYITDAAINGDGLMLDNIAIPEIGYSTGFEDGDGDWRAAGFVRIDNVLPQTYRLALVSSGYTTSVQYLTLSPDNTLDIPLRIGGDINAVTLVVTGTSRYTNEKAAYRFNIQ
jgi:hypothetical protein